MRYFNQMRLKPLEWNSTQKLYLFRFLDANKNNFTINHQKILSRTSLQKCWEKNPALSREMKQVVRAADIWNRFRIRFRSNVPDPKIPKVLPPNEASFCKKSRLFRTRRSDQNSRKSSLVNPFLQVSSEKLVFKDKLLKLDKHVNLF